MESFDHPTLWQIVTADRVTVGLFRVGILAIVGFLAVSVPALVLAGRWLKAFGTSSIAADDAEAATEALDEAQEKIQALREELGRVKSQRDTAMAIAEHLP
jgi:hypothetical protein